MTEKELRRLSRRELLEMLITRTIENERLTEELQQARKELSDRKLIQDRARFHGRGGPAAERRI